MSNNPNELLSKTTNIIDVLISIAEKLTDEANHSYDDDYALELRNERNKVEYTIDSMGLLKYRMLVIFDFTYSLSDLETEKDKYTIQKILKWHKESLLGQLEYEIKRCKTLNIKDRRVINIIEDIDIHCNEILKFINTLE